MNYRAAQLLIGLALVSGVSCIDMSAPTGGPAVRAMVMVLPFRTPSFWPG